MSAERPRDLAASVRQRLLNRARRHGEELQLVLVRDALARLRYRLSHLRRSLTV